MIRPASPVDAPSLAPLIISAMGELSGKFANSQSITTQTRLFERFIRQANNQYSFENILVFEHQGKISGMILAYDGGQLHKLRTPFLNYIRSEMGFTGIPEEETKANEFYIDCLAVLPEARGCGIGKQLINAMVQRAANSGCAAIGLLVSNADAKRLYVKLGFAHTGQVILLGVRHDHMEKKIVK